MTAPCTSKKFTKKLTTAMTTTLTSRELLVGLSSSSYFCEEDGRFKPLGRPCNVSLSSTLPRVYCMVSLL